MWNVWVHQSSKKKIKLASTYAKIKNHYIEPLNIDKKHWSNAQSCKPQ